MTHIVDSPLADSHLSGRRSFLTKAVAVLLGSVVALFPFAAGLGVLFEPLRRRIRCGDNLTDDGVARFVRIGPLDVLPADGVPHQFVLIDDVTDAWTRWPAQRVGTAFLTRTDSAAGPQIAALSSVCPHLGCAVDFNTSAGEFDCPCHASAFAKDGKKIFGPSLRGLDSLAVKLVNCNGQPEIWVQCARFRTGIAERILVG